MCPCITLTVVDGPHRGEELSSVGRTQITLGRSEECTFQLRGAVEDLLVSRRHCLINVHPDWIEIRDLESRNGTYVNGQRPGFPRSKRDGSTAFKRRLKNADVIRIGTSVLLVRLVEGTEESEFCDGVELLPRRLADV
jgi:pSer/pThr/pTyr-binding forkhead associated (FHA) protein